MNVLRREGNLCAFKDFQNVLQNTDNHADSLNNTKYTDNRLDLPGTEDTDADLVVRPHVEGGPGGHLPG